MCTTAPEGWTSCGMWSLWLLYCTPAGREKGEPQKEKSELLRQPSEGIGLL